MIFKINPNNPRNSYKWIKNGLKIKLNFSLIHNYLNYSILSTITTQKQKTNKKVMAPMPEQLPPRFAY